MNLYPIETLESDKPIVYFPEGLALGPDVRKVAFGSASMEAEILPNPGNGETAAVSTAVLQNLKLPDTLAEVRLFSNEETLYLCPLIGMFTSHMIDSAARPAGDRSGFYAKLLEACSAKGAAGFFFTELTIDWENNLIKGWFYEDGKWITRLVPFPNVIYDRVPTRRSENKPDCQLAKKRLANDYLIPWFNPGFFNKLDILGLLKDSPKAQKYMPETTVFTSIQEARRMLDRYGAIYLKPINGTLGMGIRHVIAEFPGSTCYCRYRNTKGENKLRKYRDLEVLATSMFSEERRKKMLVQQRILLLKINDRPVDFRVHTNKDANGKWQVSAIAGKLAGPGSVTTHVRSGGNIQTLEELFGKQKQSKYRQILSEAALELSLILEERFDSLTGEFGFDFGIDRNESVWLFEVNSKPGRSIFHHPGMQDYERLTREYPFDYAIHLAEKSVLAPEEVFN